MIPLWAASPKRAARGLFLSVLALQGIALAQGAGKGTTPEPTFTPVATLSPSPTPLAEKKPRWIPPPPAKEEARQITYSLAAGGTNSEGKAGAFTLFDLRARRNLDEHAVTAEGLLRLRKNLSSSDGATSFELRSAKVTYLEPWFQVSLGRMDVGQLLTPQHFFGPYPIMGVRRADGLVAVVPINFLIGVEDYKSVSAPPTALSLFYFPSLFSAETTPDISGEHAVFLGQARLKVRISKFDSTFRYTMGGSKTNYFTYSSISGSSTLSLGLDITYSRDYSLYLDYGVQNTSLPADTSALAFGVRAQRVGTWGPFSLDEAILEIQNPMGQSLKNAFTGGNTFFPDLAEVPQGTWYAKLKFRLKAIFLEFHATTSRGDFTFARLDPTAVSIPVPAPFGPSNQTDGLGLPLVSKSYKERTVLANVGVDF